MNEKKNAEQKAEAPEKAGCINVPDEKLKKVIGGGAFDDVPRVPEYPIDDETKKKFE